MKDEEKMKGQFIYQLEQMRRWIAELEAFEIERKRAEEALRETEEKYRTLFEDSRDAVYITTQDGRLVDANPSFLSLFGHTGEEITDLNVREMYANPHDRAKFQQEIEQKGSVRDYEVKLRKKNGTEMDCLITATVRRDGGESILGYQGIIRDVTRRKRAEEELHQQALIVENMHDGIIVTDLKSRIIDWNPAAERIFGYSKEEVLGKTTAGLTTDVVNATLRNGRWSGEINFIRKDGTEGVCETVIVPLRNKTGNIIATVGVNRDITDRKRAEEALQQSYDKLRRTFEETINVLASAVEIKDPYTAGHQQRVAKLVCAIAKEIGFPEEQSEGLRLAATIHDIGKIYVPSEILSKPGQLATIEYDLVKTHPLAGYEILNGIEFPWPIAQIVLQHHERLDGSGYPQGISGDAIIREARVLAVADVVEAMASHRPYRPARGVGDALEEILQHKGILYDPEVVDACVSVLRQSF